MPTIRSNQFEAAQRFFHQTNALVLSGPQGCGKTKLAQQLAAAHGEHSECSINDLEHNLKDVLLRRSKVLIVDEFVPERDLDPTSNICAVLKLMLTDHSFKVRAPYESHTKVVRPPAKIIFTTENADFIRDTGTRRFFVVNVTTSSRIRRLREFIRWELHTLADHLADFGLRTHTKLRSGRAAFWLSNQVDRLAMKIGGPHP